MDRYWFEGAFKLVDRVEEIAKELEKTPAQVSLAWLLGDRRVTAPIIGARTVEQIEDNLVAGDWDLPEDARRQLTDLLPLPLGYPQDWMASSFKGTFGVAEYSPLHEQRLP